MPWQIQQWFQIQYRVKSSLSYQPYFAGINRGTAAAVFGLNEGRSILVDSDLYIMGPLMKQVLLERKLANFREMKLLWAQLMRTIFLPKIYLWGQG